MNTLRKVLKRRGGKTVRKSEFEDTAANLEARAEKLRTGQLVDGSLATTTETTYSTAELIGSLATFVRTLGAASASADRATRVIVWLTVVGVIVAVSNAALVVVQIVEADRAINTQNAIALNAMVFHDSSNQLIISAIESHKPILVEHHGRSTSTQVDGYLGDLETVGSAYAKRQISEQELCDSYSTAITETFNNAGIRKYLHDNPDYFGGVVELNDIVKNSKTPECR